MDFRLIPLRDERVSQFKVEMMESFQQGAIDVLGEMDEEALPESHIDRALNADGARAFEALLDGEAVGGAIVTISDSNHNHLDFLYVKHGVQSKGIGQKIWQAIEKQFPETEVWETATPYFEKRNIHFYVNRCGFHIVEFFSKYHRMENHDEFPDCEYFDGFFRFEKVMKQKGEINMDKKTPAEYAEYAESLFKQGCNCAQAVVCAFADRTGFDDDFAKKLASPFGGGRGRLREVCGAVSGMFIVLGTLEGYSDVTDNNVKTELYKKVQYLAGEFEKENGSIVCRDLLGLGEGKSQPKPDERNTQYYKKRPCGTLVYTAAEILAKYLEASEG